MNIGDIITCSVCQQKTSVNVGHGWFRCPNGHALWLELGIVITENQFREKDFDRWQTWVIDLYKEVLLEGGKKLFECKHCHRRYVEIPYGCKCQYLPDNPRVIYTRMPAIKLDWEDIVIDSDRQSMLIWSIPEVEAKIDDILDSNNISPFRLRPYIIERHLTTEEIQRQALVRNSGWNGIRRLMGEPETSVFDGFSQETCASLKEEHLKRDLHYLGWIIETDYRNQLAEHVARYGVNFNLTQSVVEPFVYIDLYPGDTQIHYKITTTRRLQFIAAKKKSQ